MDEPARAPRSFRDRLDVPRPAEVPPDPPGGQAPDTPISRLIWHDFVEAELEPLREAISRLEAGQAQDRDALRAAGSGWAEQIGFLRGQTEGLEERVKGDRLELHNSVERLQEEIGRLGGYAFQTQVQERMINRVEEQQDRLADNVSELSHEVALVIERFDNRLGAIQADLARQRSRMTEMTLAVSLGAIGVIIGLAIALWPRLV
jgi:chromosome segregation ATPase